MINNIAGKPLLLMALILSSSAFAAPIEYEDVATLINQRLSLMKDVAGYKAKNHLAIEDFAQEDKVLSSTMLQAEKLGLDGDSVRFFVQAQMDAAKAIQYRYRADWLSQPEKGWEPQPLDLVRSKISLLSAAILTDISAKLTKGGQFTDKADFMKRVDQTNLKDSDKERLWESLKKITLKK